MKNFNSEQIAKRHLQDWYASGLSKSAYSKKHSLNPNYLFYWSNKFKSIRPPSEQNDLFIELPKKDIEPRNDLATVTFNLKKSGKIDGTFSFDLKSLFQ